MKSIRDKKSAFFSRNLRKKVPGVKKIILFGSRARGDAREGSDYDFAVILKKKNSSSVKAIRAAEVAFLDKYDTLSSSIIMDEPEWEKHKEFPIGINIRREGVAL